MPTVANIAVSVTARTAAFAKGLRAAARRINHFGREVKKTRRATAGLTSGLGMLAKGFGVLVIGRALFSAFRSVEKLNQSMTRSLSIMGDLSQTMRSDMRRAAIEMSRITTFSAAEIAKGFYFLASAGLTAKESLAALPIVSKFAQAGMFDMARATDLLTDALTALGLDTENTLLTMKRMTNLADVLTKASVLANATIEQFSEALTNKAAAAMKILNIPLEQGVALLAAYASQAKKGADAGTAFDIVLRELTMKAIAHKEAWRRYGIEVFDLDNNLRNLADIFADMERAFDGASAKAVKFGLSQLGLTAKSVAYTQMLIGQSEQMRIWTKELENAAGVMDEVSTKTMTRFQKAWAQLTGSWTATMDTMRPVFDFLTGLLEKYMHVTERLSLVGSGFRRITKEGRVSFVSAEEDAIMARIAKRWEDIQLAAAEAAEQTKKNAEGITALSVAEQLLRDEENEAAKAIEKATKARTKSIDKLIDSLKDAAATFGMTAEQASLYRLRMLGADDATMALAGNLARMIELKTKQAKLDREAAREAAKAAKKLPAMAVPDRAVKAMQISLARVALPGVTAQHREQLVKDPQLVETNRTLAQIRWDMKYGMVGVLGRN